jgi:sugar O-acyltransferase (sialic acid O-acetyltransferase NeuD family)
MRRLVILGGGGHASDVLSVIESAGLSAPTNPVIIVDEGDPDMRRFVQRHAVVVGSLAEATELAGSGAAFVSGVGYPAPRQRLVELAIAHGLEPVARLIHESAVLNFNVAVGSGVVVMGQTWVSPSVQLRPHAYVGYGAKLGHDCVVGEYSSLLPGCFIGGNVIVGARCLIGANATILPGVVIGDDSQVGAGAVVNKDVAPGVTVVGVPAAATQGEAR